MQSSAATAFRAVVMLACLIVIPLAALVGTELPDLAKNLLRDHLGLVSISSQSSLNDGPAFASVAQAAPPYGTQAAPAADWGANGWSFDPRWSGQKNQLGQLPQPLPAGSPAVASKIAGAFGASGDAARVHGGATQGAMLASHHQPAASSGGLEFLRWPENPMNDDSNAHAVTPAAAFGPPDPTPAVVGQPSGERFTEIQQRFRHLGATYTLLETWGDQGQLYRFYCRIGMAGSSTYSRYFEATDEDPLGAMDKVLAQVEAWRSAGRP